MSKYQEEKDATAVPSDVPKPASTDLPMIIAPNMGEKRIIKIFRIDKEKSIEIKKAILETLNASKNNKNETCSSSSKCIPSSTLDKSIKNEFTQQENKGNIISNQVKSSISRTQTLGSIIKIKREASSTAVTKKDHESKPEEVEILTYPPITNKSITELSAKIPSFDKLNTYLKEKRGNDPIVQKDVISENVEKKLSTQIETSVSIDYNQIKIKEDIGNKVDEDSPNTVNNRSLKDNIKFGELFPKDSNMGKKPLVINPAKRSDLSEITSHIGTSSSYLVSNNNKNLDDSTKSCSSDNKYQINKTSLNQNSTKSLVKKLTNVPETEPENAVDLLLKTFGDGTKLNVTYFGEDEHMLDELEYDFDLDELVNEKSEKEKVCKEDNELQIDCHNSQNPPVEIKNTVELLNKSHTDNKTTEMEKINTGAIIIENKILTENEKIDLTTLQNKKLLSSPPVQIKEQKSNSTTEPEVIVIVGNSISGSTIPKKINSQEDKSNSSCKKVVKSYRKGKINLVERKKQNTIEPLKTKSGIEDKTKLTKDFLNKPKDLKGGVLNEGQSSLKQNTIEPLKTKSGMEVKTKLTAEFLNKPKDLKGSVLNEGQSSLKQTAIELVKPKSGIEDKTKMTSEFLTRPKDLKGGVLNEGQSSLKQNTIEPLKIKSGIVDRSKMTAEFLDRPKTLKVSTECTAVKMFKIEMSNPLSDSYNDEFLDKINNKNIKNIQNIQNQKPTDGDVLIHKDNVKFPTDKFHSIQESNKSFNKPDVPKSIEVDLVDEDKNCFQPKSLNCSPNKSTRPEIESSSKKNLTPIKNSEWNANAANTEKASVSACVSNTNILLKPSLKKKTDDSKGSNQRNRKVSFDLSDIQKLKEDKRISCSLKPVKKGSQSQPFSNNLKKKETSAESIKVTFSNISTDCKNNEEDKTSKDIKENAEISPHFQDMKLSNESNKDIDLIVIDPENVGSQIKDVTSNDDTNFKKGLKEENNDSDDSDFIGFEESEIFNYTFDANKFRKSLKKKPKTLYDFFKKSSKPNISANKAQNQIPKVTSKTTKLVSNIISPDSDDDIKVPLKKRKIQQVENMEVEFTNSKDNSKLLKSTKNNDSLHNQSSEISNISNTEVAMTDSPIIKKRGRKPKNESNVSSDNIGISIPKKRGRKPKNWNSDCSTDDGILNKSIENPTVNNYDSTMLLLQGKDRKLIPADNTNYVPLPNDVQCGLCKEYTLRKNWNNHLGSHYGIGWIQGDSEINVESYTIVLNAMLKYQKSCKIQGFKCRMCGNMLKSALGVMTHIQTCQLSAEAKKARLGVRCEHCNNQYSVFSIPNHLKTCRSLAMKIRNKNKEVNPETELPTPETQTFTNTGRIKRKSVIKAEKIIKNVESSVHFDPDEFIQVDNSQEKEQFIKWRKEIQIHGFAKCLTKECNFTGNTFEIMKDHAKGCQTTDERCFQCKVCKYRNIDLELVKSHVIENHQTLDFNNDDHDSDTEIKFDAESEDEDTSVDDNYCEADKLFEDLVAVDVKKSVKRKSTKLEDKSKRVYKIKRNINIIQQTIQLTQFFVDTHLTSQILFDTALPRPVKGTCSKDRLPKNFQSMKFAYSSDNEFNHESGKSKPATDWMSLKQFESKQTKDELLLYIGGPIKYLAWVPISCKEMTSQYLAVVYRRCFNTFSRTIETNPKKTSILIYEIGNPNSMTDPKLLYAITIDTGPVHYLEFMPSGGYAPKINRLGLLAVGSTDFNIKIYALPIKPTTFANNTESDKNIIFLELEPAFILTLDCRKNWLNAEIYCTFQTYRIAWSEVKGHNHIVAGFSNGGVAIWDITNEEDNMNRMVKQNVINYIPICFFRDCEKGIVDIKLHYNNNLRWMAVASISRQIFVYDLKNLNRPVMISQDTGKNEVTCVDWPVIWENYNIGLGEVLATYGCVLTTMSPSGIVFKNRRSAKTVNGITSAHFNYWYNISAVGSENGDTFVEFMREMNLDITKVSNTCQKLLAYVDIVGLNENCQVQYEEYTEKKKVPTDWRIFDTDYMENYGLVFGPLSKYTKEKITLVTNKKRNPGVNRFAFVQVNCVRFNLNQNVKNILAIGYENGTIRIMKVKP